MGHQGLEFIAMVAFYFAKASIDCSTKGGEGVVKTTIQHLFVVNFHNRSIKFRFGEYDGRNSNSMFKLLVKSLNKAHQWNCSKAVTAPSR